MTIFASAVLLVATTAGGADDQWAATPPAPKTVAFIQRVVGNPDPAALPRLAAETTARQLIAAIYRGTRSERMAALEAAAYVADPWPILPYLAAIMSGPERQTASRATNSLFAAISRVQRSPTASTELVPKQGRQLASQLLEVAQNTKLDPDVRASALGAVAVLSEIDGLVVDFDPALTGDPEVAVRGAALALLDPPLDEQRLNLVATIAAGDANPILRGQAAGLLCENALIHGVAAPSPDLRKLLGTVLSDATVPASSLAPILGCLIRFPAAARSELIDAAFRHPDQAIKQYWEELSLGTR